MTAVAAGSALEALRAAIRGDVIGADDPRYDEARAVNNGMVDKRPALIVRCVDVADARAALAYGRAEGLDIAIRGGGHSAAGQGTVDNGLVIDLSRMKWVRVDPATSTVVVGAGCTLGDVDHATHTFGLAVPIGVLGTTGIAGLTLGGGTGHLTRRYGLAIDNLLEVDMILADGSVVRASADENQDLFWALRGGGGNFGIVTGLMFRAHHQPTVVAGPTLWPIEQAADAMRFYRDFMADAPDEMNGFFAFLTVPPGPPFPEELHGKIMCGVVWCYTGDSAGADAAFAPVRAFGPPALDGIGELPLPAIQGAFDPLYPAGLQQYWRADYVSELSDDAIAVYVEHGAGLPTPLSSMHLYPIDGAASRVGKGDTAWSYREAKWAQVIFGVDPDPAKAELLRSWTIDYWEAVHPYAASGGGGYVNFMGAGSEDRVRAAYRDNYDRLAKIKGTYDPDNVFHVNWNIKPE